VIDSVPRISDFQEVAVGQGVFSGGLAENRTRVQGFAVRG
jgi:hypothetical protein